MPPDALRQPVPPSSANPASPAAPHEAAATAGRQASAPTDLRAQLEAKLGRPLTPAELAVLAATPQPTVTADKLAMPAVARELYDLYSGFMNRLTFQLHSATPAHYEQLPPALRRPRFTAAVLHALRGVAVLSTALPIGCGVAAFNAWIESLALHQQYPQFAAEAPLQLILLGLGCLFLPLIIWQWVDAIAVVGKLGPSGLLEQLVDGDPSLDEIYPATPLPWRWLFMGGPGRSLRGRALLLGHYLDWFVGPRRTHFRWYWAQLALTLTAGPVLVALAYLQSGSGPRANLWGVSSLACGVLQALLPMATVVFNTKSIFCGELLRQLRARFGVLPPTPEEAAAEQQRRNAMRQQVKRVTSRQEWRDSLRP